jgi:hypothetical protein
VTVAGAGEQIALPMTGNSAVFKKTLVAVQETWSLMFEDQTSLQVRSDTKEAVRQIALAFRSAFFQYFLLTLAATAALLVALYGLIRARFRVQALRQDKAEHAMNGYEVAFAGLHDLWIAKLLRSTDRLINRFTLFSPDPPASGINPAPMK